MPEHPLGGIGKVGAEFGKQPCRAGISQFFPACRKFLSDHRQPAYPFRRMRQAGIGDLLGGIGHLIRMLGDGVDRRPQWDHQQEQHAQRHHRDGRSAPTAEARL